MSGLLGQMIGEYRIVEFLGAGGMGEVYRRPTLQDWPYRCDQDPHTRGPAGRSDRAFSQ